MHKRDRSLPIDLKKIDKLTENILILRDSLRSKREKVQDFIKRKSKYTNDWLSNPIFKRVEFNSTIVYQDEKRKANEFWSKIKHDEKIKALGLQERYFSLEHKNGVNECEAYYFDKNSWNKIRECFNIQKRDFGKQSQLNKTIWFTKVARKTPKKRQTKLLRRDKVIDGERRRIYKGISHGKVVTEDFTRPAAESSVSFCLPIEQNDASLKKTFFKNFALTHNA
ncbi:unnamed protein product [Blepharisma stoltei]|uniref:Ycf1 n=1 Tax=Blepharisma stoltei TaxID=1481888 RepID=A0AAU9K151_9CILI|nr:unnamed protein product [Blepharisma stoltei]